MNKKIVCFGDSNTWGYIPGSGKRYDPDVRWPGKLAFITGDTVVEEGLNGRTSAFPDPGLPWATGTDYIEACVCSHEPIDLLIIMLGTNDMKTYVSNCADASAKGIAKAAAMARNALGRQDLKVLLVSPIEIGERCCEIEEIKLQFNADSVSNSKRLKKELQEQADLHHCYFLNAAEYAKPSEIDAIHLDHAGHAMLAEAIAVKIKEILGES